MSDKPKPQWWITAIVVVFGIVWASAVISIGFVISHFVAKFW